MTNQFPVIGGPSKFDLSNALFAWNPRRPVIFNANCPIGTEFEVYVMSVQAEDGSGESWNIEGKVGEVKRLKHAGQENLFLPERTQSVFIYFHTHRRQGHVKFFEKSGPCTLAELHQAVQRVNEKVYGDGSPVCL
jgi:hypothetical protein